MTESDATDEEFGREDEGFEGTETSLDYAQRFHLLRGLARRFGGGEVREGLLHEGDDLLGLRHGDERKGDGGERDEL